jgi:hypothetical protein
MEHIVVLPRKPLESILGGVKTIETIFTKDNQPPYKAVNVNDTIYLRAHGGYAVAKANAVKVENFDNLTPRKVVELLETYKNEIAPTTDMYETKIYSKYATFVWLEDVQEIRPFRINEKAFGANKYWLTVDNIEKIKTK